MLLVCFIQEAKEIGIQEVGLGDSSDGVTIIIISVTITTVIVKKNKNYYCDSGHVVTNMCI